MSLLTKQSFYEGLKINSTNNQNPGCQRGTRSGEYL
jgi:hypothetical protein